MARLLLAAVAAALSLASSFSHAAPVTRGEPASAAKALARPELRLGTSPDAALRITLAPITEAEVEAVRAHNRTDDKMALASRPLRLAVGIARPIEGLLVTAAGMKWLPVPGGHAAQVALTSPEAGSLRVAIDLAGVPADVEMVFFGSAATARVEGPVRAGDVADRTLPWYSPLTEGDTQTVEFFVPSRHAPAALELSVAGGSHIFTTPSSRFTKRVADIGLAGSCNVDIPCSSLASNTAFRNTVESVAQMVFSDAGFTILCTGTLLADGDASSQAPWFYSANHCFENEDPPYKTAAQMQTVANTLTTLWGFEASACNSGTPRSGWTQVGGGATLIHNSVTTDVLFLRLNSAPPSGAYFSGWDANALSPGTSLLGIHHPQGDLKKASQGSMVGFEVVGVAGGNASFIEALWSSGTTETGSSGSGVFSPNDGQYLFRGGLWGGSALCTNRSGTDYFSRFDQAYPTLAQYLGSGSAPAADYTDLWWNPNESGWGLKLIQHPTRNMFGVWYTYELDGSRTWFVMPGGSWSNANTFTGALYTTAGPGFTVQPFDPAQVQSRQVGTATITFTDANNGTFAYSVDGISGSKSITRQPF
jgi:lysyl endopeptidase